MSHRPAGTARSHVHPQQYSLAEFEAAARGRLHPNLDDISLVAKVPHSGTDLLPLQPARDAPQRHHRHPVEAVGIPTTRCSRPTARPERGAKRFGLQHGRSTSAD